MMPRKHRKLRWLTCLAGVLASTAPLVLTTSCGSARREQPLVGPLKLNEREQLGQVVFMQHCYQCHPGGRAGVGPALNDKPLPALAIRTQIRLGAGAMPSFDENRIDEAQLHAVADYLVALRNAE